MAGVFFWFFMNLPAIKYAFFSVSEYLWKLPEELLTEEIEKSGVVVAEEEVETIDEAEVEMTVEAVMVDETDQFGLTNMDLRPEPIFVLLWKIFLAVSAGRYL